MKILLATSNRHKLKEFAALLPGVSLAIPADLGLPFAPEETGSSFLENALIKARALFEASGQPVLADDSGLCVDALGGAPGVHSARFGSEGGAALTDGERNALLLSRMKGERNRACRFVCCLVLCLGCDRFFAAQETLEGVLLGEPRGEGGFGYDPLVFLPELGKSVAELSAEEKNRVSHRAKAAFSLRRAAIGIWQEAAAQ